MFRSWRQSVRELGERVERLEGALGRLNMENADLKSQLKERDARIAKLESVLEESRRAGKRQAAPFSKDKPKRDPKKPGRKPGSKYGRQAVRAIPVPDKTFEAPCPEQCPCGGKVGAEGSIDLYQVDIPPIQPETWKFVVGHGHCQECGRRVRGQHPLLISKAFEVGTVHFGPRLLAFAAFQKMICGVSYDKIRLGFEQMLGFPVARSTLCRAMQRLARRAKPTRDALVEALRASPVVYADETGWKQGGRRVWLWVFTNLRETVYEILPGRGFEQAASVLGKNYAGTLGVDGWAPYRCFKEATLQTCYNHLLHRCHELLETATRGAVRFPRLVKAILRHALALRDRRDAGEISPHGLRVAKGLLQAKMNRLLHGRFTNPANQRFAKHLRRYRDNLFVFLDRADVEATNYPAEQDIRIAVAHEVTAGGTLARATRLQLGRGRQVCPDSIRNFGSIPPPPRSDSTLALEAGLLRGRLRSVAATPPRPTSNELEVATLGFDDHRSSALRSCSPSGYEFAPSRACPWARRSPRRPLSGVGAELSVLARTPIPSSPPSWPRSPLSSVAVSDRLGRLPRP